MACMKLGSKFDVFHREGQAWHCSTGLPSDVIIEIGEVSFHLHKFPLLSRSGLLESLIGELSSEDGNPVLQLHDVPGGARAFLLIAKFSYGVKIEITASNVVSLRCAAEFLRMTQEYGEGNLIVQTENFLVEIFGYWTDSLTALESCEEVLPHAEDLHIVSRCINSLAMKASADPSLFSWPMSGRSSAQSPEGSELWNGICIRSKPHTISEDWWYEEVSSLRFPLYKRLILAVGDRSMKPERISGSLIYYAKKNLPLLCSQSSFQNESHGSNITAISDGDQRNLLEEIVELLPNEIGVTPTKFLLRLLRTSMVLHVSSASREKLEKRVGAELEEAALEDLLIPNMGYSVETLYDIDCVQRLLDHFMLFNHDEIDSKSACVVDEEHIVGASQQPLTPLTKVANLVDGYLAEVAPDVNMKLSKFQSLAAVIPECGRPSDDGIYRAIDIFLKAHPWLTDSEKEQLCRQMNCQRLSVEASTHAAQNERLPLRVVVQILFFEQLRLRNLVTRWFFVSDQIENSHNHSGNLALARNDAGNTHHLHFVGVDEMEARVSEIEKECLSMKQELEKIMKTKGSWNMVWKKLGFRVKSKSCDLKTSKPCNKSKVSPASAAPIGNERENHDTVEVKD